MTKMVLKQQSHQQRRLLRIILGYPTYNTKPVKLLHLPRHLAPYVLINTDEYYSNGLLGLAKNLRDAFQLITVLQVPITRHFVRTCERLNRLQAYNPQSLEEHQCLQQALEALEIELVTCLIPPMSSELFTNQKLLTKILALLGRYLKERERL